MTTVLALEAVAPRSRAGMDDIAPAAEKTARTGRARRSDQREARMGTRVIELQEPGAPLRGGVARLPDPAGTRLMLAVSGTVLAATVLVASMSSVPHGAGLSASQRPEPAPPPTWTSPQPVAPTSMLIPRIVGE